jgi:ribose 5-phosphate isomerase B
MKFYIASDHAGFELKQHLIKHFELAGIPIKDMGPFEYVAGDDYPDWISKAAEEVSKNPDGARAIVLGYSGQGEAMVANKFKNVRAGVYYGHQKEIVKLLREHNDCNVLSLSAKFLTHEEAERAVDTWIDTEFSEDERHVRRIEKMKKLEENI